MAKSRRLKPRYDTPEGPAIITPDHVQDRSLTKAAGAPKGWSKLAIYEREYRLKHLASNDSQGESWKAQDRRDAAKAMDEGWAICNASWPSGFDPSKIKVAGCPGSFVDHQRDVKDFWRRVELAMSINDWMICRRICGEGYKVAQAVNAIDPKYKNLVMVRFRDALDGLIVGMQRARRTR